MARPAKSPTEKYSPNLSVIHPETDEAGQEEKFLTDVLAGYAYWNKQTGDKAKGYAEAYKALLNEFTKDEKE